MRQPSKTCKLRTSKGCPKSTVEYTCERSRMHSSKRPDKLEKKRKDKTKTKGTNARYPRTPNINKGS